MTTLLIRNGHVLTMNDQNQIHSPGWVWVENDRIQAVGAGQPADELAAQAERVIDAAHMAVLPGLVNGHTHFSQTFMRGLGAEKPLFDWLKQIMWPLQAALTPEEMRLASLLGLVENLRCGVTGVIQHHKIVASPAHVDAAAEAAEIVGLRLRLARGWVDLGEGAEPQETIIHDMTRLHERWHGAAGGRISVAFGPMVPWRCSDKMMRRTVELARRWGLATHIHVAEVQDEIRVMRERNGLRSVEWLDALGLLGADLQLVHCVWVDEAELELMAASGALAVHCPVSNMYLASGVAPVRQMLERGIPVGLGTDGPASNNSQDLLETMKIAALLAKINTGDARALLPADVLRMVTTTGARLLGQEALLGQIKPGFKADMTLVNLDTSRSMPVHQPENALVYNAAGPDVHTVIVDGRLLLDAGRVTVLDEAALLEACRLAAGELLARVGLRS